MYSVQKSQVDYQVCQKIYFSPQFSTVLPTINYTQQLPLILVNHVNMFQALILEDISPLENRTDTHGLHLHIKWGV